MEPTERSEKNTTWNNKSVHLQKWNPEFLSTALICDLATLWFLSWSNKPSTLADLNCVVKRNNQTFKNICQPGTAVPLSRPPIICVSTRNLYAARRDVLRLPVCWKRALRERNPVSGGQAQDRLAIHAFENVMSVGCGDAMAEAWVKQRLVKNKCASWESKHTTCLKGLKP